MKALINSRVRTVLVIFSLIVAVGILIEYHPKTRGTLHDAVWVVRNCSHFDSPVVDGWQVWELPREGRKFALYSRIPSGDAVSDYERRIADWRSGVAKRFPAFEFSYRDIPDSENGFYHIHQWAEVDPALGTDSMPAEVESLLKWRADREWLGDEQFVEANRWLEIEGQRVARAWEIGHLGTRSVVSSEGRYQGRLEVGFSKSAVQRLELVALMAAWEGDADRAYEAALAVTGWAGHFLEIETPGLIATRLGRSIETGLKHHLYYRVLPLLTERSEAPLDLERWEQFFDDEFDERDAREERITLWRGEWETQLAMLSVMIPRYHPRDPEALLDAITQRLYARAMQTPRHLVAKEIAESSDGLTRKSRDLFTLFLIGVDAYEVDLLRQRQQKLLIPRGYKLAVELP